MGRQTWNKLLLGFVCCQFIPCAYLTCAAADSAGKEAGSRAGDANKPQAVEEVTVSADHLLRMKLELQKAQDAFFAEYNRANTIPEFQTRCDMETDSTTRMNIHACTPKFVFAAREYYAQMQLRGEDVAPPIFSINGKMPAYRKHVHEVVDHDPKLADQARQFVQLSERYDAFYKAHFARRLESDH